MMSSKCRQSESTLSRSMRFSSVNRFLHVRLTQHLLAYLKRSFNEEGFLFLLDVRKFKEATDPSEQVQLLLYIFDTYIMYPSKKEINVDGIEKSAVKAQIDESKQWENVNNMLVPSSIFDKIYTTVLRELKEDAFPRYVRSLDFLDFAQSMGESFVQSIAVPKEHSERARFMISTEDLKSISITDKDVCFILKMCEDSSEWEALRITKRGEKERKEYGFISRTKYSLGQNLQGMTLTKITGNVNFSAEQLFYAIIDENYFKEWDKISCDCKLLDYIPCSDVQPYSASIAVYGANIGPLFTRRRCLMVSTILYDTVRQCFMLIGKTTLKQTLESYGESSTKKKVIPMTLFSGLCVYKISETKSRYVQLVYSDLQIGKDPSRGILKKILKKHATTLHVGYERAVTLREKNGDGGRPENCRRFMETYDDFVKRYIPTGTEEKTWSIK